MIPLSTISWGPADAKSSDKQFSNKWIEPEHIKRCLSSNSWIISGEKGSGKTAIRKALTDIYKANYIATPVVDFDNVTFNALYSEVLEFSKTTNLSKTATLSRYWQYSIMVEIIKACAISNSERYGSLLHPISDERTNVALSQRLLKLMEEVWNMIDHFTGIRSGENSPKARKANLLASSGLSARLLHDLSKFPLDREYEQIKSHFFKLIEATNDRVVLILDGFDKLRNDGTAIDSIRLIFASLVDAVLAIRSDSNLPDSIAIKAFIPHDRYLGLALRDSDKLDTLHSAIRWDRSSLEDFVRKRISVSTRVPNSSFTSLWRQVFPETVTNGHHLCEEDSFDYVLRHTMYRPRQLQIHLENLCKRHDGLVIDPSMVPKAIQQSSKDIARHFINEYSIDHPKLGKFIQSFDKKCNVMEYKQFREIVEVFNEKHAKVEDETTDDKVDMLYSMGFFGVVGFVDPGEPLGERYYPPTRSSKRHYIDFFYKEPHPAISGALSDDSVVALHPIFVDYANLKLHSDIVVG